MRVSMQVMFRVRRVFSNKHHCLNKIGLSKIF